MCASRYGPNNWPASRYPRIHPPPSFSPFSRPTPSPTTSNSQLTVKVENLAKTTREDDLWGRLKDFRILSIKVVHCPNAPVNFAYVNCADQASAQGIVEAVHEKMLLHQNQLRAKIKGQVHRPYGASNAGVQPPRSTTKDICAVKVLIYENSLTESDIDDYFRRYGELSHASKIREGEPVYVYVNFVEPSSAHRARSDSPHDIQDVIVVAVPYKTTRHGPPVNPTQGLVTLGFSCKPLAFAHAKKELLSEFNDQQMVKVGTMGDRFVAHVQTPIAGLVKNRIESIIATHESGVESKELQLEFYYLPVLADLEIQKLIYDIKLPCQLMISRGPDKVELGELAANFSVKNKGPSEQATLERYLTSFSAAEGSGTNKWYWFDEDTFQPYMDRISDQIEKKFKGNKDYLKIGIGRHNYIIDTIKLVQINTQTRTKRPIQRRAACPPDVSHSTHSTHSLVLHIAAYKDHTSELQREIKEILSKSIDESSVHLSDIATRVESFTAVLLGTARRNYIQASLNKDGVVTMVLRGKHLLVKSTEVELQAEILKKEREMAKMSRVCTPDHWEPQIGTCELKPVAEDSQEWIEIQDKMQQGDFKVDITKIERIQNTWLWETYQMSRKRMSDKNDGRVNEKKLFHGPRQNRPKDIYDSEQGFDHRLASPGLWGEGTYFAVESNYSHKYAYTLPNGSHQLFLVNVITGITCKCSSSERTLKAPPKKSERRYEVGQVATTAKFEGERFDSVSGHANGSEIYIIYELGRVYPAYLITYNTHKRSSVLY